MQRTHHRSSSHPRYHGFSLMTQRDAQETASICRATSVPLIGCFGASLLQMSQMFLWHSARATRPGPYEDPQQRRGVTTGRGS